MATGGGTVTRISVAADMVLSFLSLQADKPSGMKIRVFTYPCEIAVQNPGITPANTGLNTSRLAP
jgi:hypothetical protein